MMSLVSGMPKENRMLAAIIALGAFLRLYQINVVPPGLRFDESFNLLDILALMQGQFAIFFPANNGREPLFNYLCIVLTALLGAQPLALRLTAAIVGIATILLTYGFVGALFRSKQVGLFAAFFLSISVWHIYYSRYGLRTVLELPLTILTLWWFWNALQRRRTRDFVLAGVCLAFAVYTYLTGRLLPFVLIVSSLAASMLDRQNARVYIQGLVLTGLVAFVLFLPLGAYFAMHPDHFGLYSAALSIFDARVNRGDVPGTLWNNLGKIAGMFLVRGDVEEFRNVPYRPVFDPFVGALFIVGLALLLRDLCVPKIGRVARLRAIFISVTLLMLLSASALSDAPPNFTRTLPVLSVLVALPAWGVTAVWDYVRVTSARQIVATMFCLGAFASTALSFHDYFIHFANLSSLYYAFDVHMYDTSQWLKQNAPTNQIYLAPLWSQQGTLMLLTRYAPVKSFDSRDTMVLPARAEGKDALYVFPAEQEKRAQTMLARLGALGAREQLIGSNGAPLGWVVRVPAQNLPTLESPISTLSRGGDFLQPQRTTRAVWGDALELLGYSVEASDAAKRNLEVTLFLRAAASMKEDYTFSVKVRDEKGRVWGQEDKWAGTNSYATRQWSVGDVVIERFYSGLSACASAGEYRLTVEAYEPRTMRVLGLTDREGAEVELGVWRAEASPGNLYEHLEPEQKLDVVVAPQVRLLGYSLDVREASAGAEFSLALFWRGWGDGQQRRHITIRLRDASARDFVLQENDVTLPPQGRGGCLFFDVRLPRDAAIGTGTLWVNDVQIATMKVTR